jgi:hypothetical protein
MIMGRANMIMGRINLLLHRYHGSCSYSKVLEYQTLLVDLIDNLSILHSRYRTVIFDRISVEECEDIIDSVLSGDYELSPILVYHLNMKEIDYDSFCRRKTVLSSAFCGLLRYYTNPKEGYITVVRPSTDRDVLLIAALEQVLLENTVNWKCPSIENLIYDYHSDINKEMVRVNRIYRIDIDSPPDIGIFLRRLSSINLQPDMHLYQFITSFLNLSYIDEDGLCHESNNGTYTVGDIARIVHNLIFKEIFDSSFRNQFPGVAFTRFVYQVIVGTKDSDDVVFNEEEGYALLNSLGLTGQIVSIGLDDDPIPICGNQLLYIDSRL